MYNGKYIKTYINFFQITYIFETVHDEIIGMSMKSMDFNLNACNGYKELKVMIYIWENE